MKFSTGSKARWFRAEGKRRCLHFAPVSASEVWLSCLPSPLQTSATIGSASSFWAHWRKSLFPLFIAIFLFFSCTEELKWGIGTVERITGSEHRERSRLRWRWWWRKTGRCRRLWFKGTISKLSRWGRSCSWVRKAWFTLKASLRDDEIRIFAISN